MGVDSGLPDFRGNEGFWTAYPAFRKLGLSFVKLANPAWFRSDPHLAWGFYGHRRNLYRDVQPHAGFGVLLQWAQRMPRGVFVFTSNVDGHFQRAGFSSDRIVECHGTLEHLQCVACCSTEIWPASPTAIEIDDTCLRALPPLPSCPHCGGLARPNVLMFGDYEWLESRTKTQLARYKQWRRFVRDRRLVAIELGAGTTVPTVRIECEAAGQVVVRVNPREPEVPANGIGLHMGALDAILSIDALL